MRKYRHTGICCCLSTRILGSSNVILNTKLDHVVSVLKHCSGFPAHSWQRQSCHRCLQGPASFALLLPVSLAPHLGHCVQVTLDTLLLLEHNKQAPTSGHLNVIFPLSEMCFLQTSPGILWSLSSCLWPVSSQQALLWAYCLQLGKQHRYVVCTYIFQILPCYSFLITT